MRRLAGIVGVRNSIEVKTSLAPENIQNKIEDAFRRLAQVDAARIKVQTNGSEVTLDGEVRSWAERGRGTTDGLVTTVMRMGL